MPELRKDPISGRWVIIANERAKRPHQFGEGNDTARGEPCPFCAGNEAMTPPEVLAYRSQNSSANAPGWSVRVVPNKYPALVRIDPRTIASGDRIYQARPAVGIHEVVIESPDHVVNMGGLGVEQMTRVLRAYRARVGEMQKDPRWRYMLIYKNQGDRAGATLEHIHSQLIALPELPARAAEELTHAKQHHESTGRCIYCDMILRQISDRDRLVLSSERFVALCPFAPRFAFETWILPKRHTAAFEQCSDEDLSHLASMMRELIAKLNHTLNDPPFNYLTQSMHLQAGDGAHYHWRIELLPQIARAAGFEWGTGMHINSVAPEDAARFLRDATV